MIKYVSDFLKMNDVEFKKAIKMSTVSTVKIGGIADIVAYPNSENQMIMLVTFFEKQKIPYKIVGRMSNILPSDERYNGVLIKTDRMDHYRFGNCGAVASAGVLLTRLAIESEKLGFSGFEEIAGIPGSIGGAVTGNAGAFGKEICDTVTSVVYFDIKSGTVNRISAEDCDFEYRSSLFKKLNGIVLSVDFCLTKSDSLTIRNKRMLVAENRRKTQPYGAPSLGSTFKRPSLVLSAGKLIDECGLKGYCIGGAEISNKHAGFVVNKGKATAKDYLAVSEYAKNEVLNKFGVRLEYEIEIM